VLVETHTAAEVDVALGAGARVIGINNRDLKTFETRLETTLGLLPSIPPGVTVVSESGFAAAADVRRVVSAGAHAVLIGEGLVKAPDVGAKVRELALR
jgi:indole-3-glycerol phosphate synthase